VTEESEQPALPAEDGEERAVRSVRVRRAAVLLGLAGYFALMVVPAWHPSLLRSGMYLIYLVSLPFTLLSLLVAGVWGGVGWWRRRGEPAWHAWHRSLLIIGVAGFGLFFAAQIAIRLVDHGLPIGSHTARFDAEVWRAQDPFAKGGSDLTARQKMVGDLVDRVLPGLTRNEIEALLGPSPQTDYLVTTGRDLMYPLGGSRIFIPIDDEWLLIWLDTDGRCALAAVVTE
jgi:hypothetical protein